MTDEMSLSKLDKAQPLILIVAVLLGFLVGTASDAFGTYSDFILTVVIVLLVYAVMLGVPAGRIWSAFKNIRFFSVAWFANFVAIPLIAWGLAYIFVGNHPAIYVGLILYLITPCTDWFLTFTSMAKGDVPLGLALLPTNLVLQILLIPVYLFIFAGAVVPIQLDSLVETFLIFILLPFILSVATRWIFTKARTREWTDGFIVSILSPFQLIVLVIVLFVMFASQTNIVLHNIGPLSLVFIPIIIFFVISFILAQLLSKWGGFKYKECALLTCTTAARNSPLVLAIGIGLFPNQPLIHVAIIIGVLIELPLLILVVRLLRVVRTKFYSPNS